MTGMHSRSKLAEFKSELEAGRDSVRDLVRSTLQEILEEEMTEALGAAKSERTSDRLGYRSGYCKRHLTTRVGQIELRVPQDRNGASGTELFERCERSERRPAAINWTHLTLRSVLWRPAAGWPKAPPNPTIRESAVEATDSRGQIGNRSSESLSSGLRGRSSCRGCSETEP